MAMERKKNAAMLDGPLSSNSEVAAAKRSRQVGQQKAEAQAQKALNGSRALQAP